MASVVMSTIGNKLAGVNKPRHACRFLPGGSPRAMAARIRRRNRLWGLKNWATYLDVVQVTRNKRLRERGARERNASRRDPERLSNDRSFAVCQLLFHGQTRPASQKRGTKSTRAQSTSGTSNLQAELAGTRVYERRHWSDPRAGTC